MHPQCCLNTQAIYAVTKANHNVMYLTRTYCCGSGTHIVLGYLTVPQMVDSQVEPCLRHYTQELGQHLKSPFTTAENHLRLGRINVHHRRGWDREEYPPRGWDSEDYPPSCVSVGRVQK